MNLVGMMPVRNEDWVLGLSLRVALMWCDEVVVLLHACTDRSREIAVEVQQEQDYRVAIYETVGAWDEMNHRQEILTEARARGAKHLAIIDADEVLTGNLLEPFRLTDGTQDAQIRNIIRVMPPTTAITELPGYNLRNGIHQYHSNGIWGNRWFSTAFADDPALSWTGDTFHHREPHGKKLQPYRPIQQGQGGVLHLWGASERRLIARHALYKITERLRWPGKSIGSIDRDYSWAIHGDKQNPAFGTPATWTYSPVPESWWAPYAHLMKYLDVDAEPWQERECQRLVAEHGREKFAGLDLFGVA